MNSAQRLPSSSLSSQHQEPAAAAAKKKLGQNLNKLTRPPAPSSSSSAASTGVKANGSARNGLLLLSTKRSAASTTGNITTTSTTTTAAPLKSFLSLEPASFHPSDTLQQQQPDAWGVAATERQQSNMAAVDAMELGSITLVNNQQHQQQQQHMPSIISSPLRQRNQFDSRLAPYEPVHGSTRHQTEPGVLSNDHRGSEASTGTAALSRSFPDRSKVNGDVDKQSAFMSQLAREKAEARRAEEESRWNEQKERAALRLRELEAKLAMPPVVDVVPSSKNVAGNKNIAVLEPLGPSGALGGDDNHNPSQPWQTPNRPKPSRTLFNPNATAATTATTAWSYTVNTSSSAGGTPVPRENGEKIVAEPGSARKAETSNAAVVARDQQNHFAGPVIQLSSYEDRDRGERSNAAAPRMLYDPKSGSMVAVPTKEEAVRGRKERQVKRGKKDRDAPVTLLSKTEQGADVEYDSTTEGPRSGGKKNGKVQNEDSWHKRGKSRSDSTDHSQSSKGETRKKGQGRGGGGGRNKQRTLPRTCGVLYARDGDGNCYPVDGCDGDLGYGAYSVPGGPTRNPEAYAKFIEKHQIYQPTEGDDVMDDYLYETEQYNSQHEDSGGPVVTLQTGFHIVEPVPKVDWVKPNEKIELITGGDESPTLQATAREWAPSQAALAAAAAVAATQQQQQQLAKAVTTTTTTSVATTTTAATTTATITVQPLPPPPTTASVVTTKESPSLDIPRPESEITSDPEDDDDVPSFIGLGFDPTLNMDSVIQSPAVRAKPSDTFDGVDLAALSLEPPLSSKNRNIFAFGSSATWGDNADGTTTDWGDLGLGSLNNGFLSGRFGKDGADVPLAAATFLSLSDKTWVGSTSITGLGATSLTTGTPPTGTTGE